jgi:serine/threonine-protein kinase RsbW
MDEAETNRQSISLHNNLSDCGRLADFLARYVETFKISDETYNDLRLVLEEAFVNIVSYAFKPEDVQTITVELDNTADDVRITFIDNGIAFNPLSYTAECEAGDDRCEGGMGIHLIRSLTDFQEYNRIGQSNVFTLTKHYTNK